jgi:hypothetical protein
MRRSAGEGSASDNEARRGAHCLTLFGFGKWQGIGNSKNGTTLRWLDNAIENRMFLSNWRKACPDALARYHTAMCLMQRAAYIQCSRNRGLALWQSSSYATSFVPMRSGQAHKPQGVFIIKLSGLLMVAMGRRNIDRICWTVAVAPHRQ